VSKAIKLVMTGLSDHYLRKQPDVDGRAQTGPHR